MKYSDTNQKRIIANEIEADQIEWNALQSENVKRTLNQNKVKYHKRTKYFKIMQSKNEQ